MASFVTWVSADGTVYKAEASAQLAAQLVAATGRYDTTLYSNHDKVVGAFGGRKADVAKGITALDARPGARMYLYWHGGTNANEGICHEQDVPRVAQIALAYEAKIAVIEAQLAEATALTVKPVPASTTA